MPLFLLTNRYFYATLLEPYRCSCGRFCEVFREEVPMIIKKQDLPSNVLADFINFINSDRCKPAGARSSVVTLKCVSPGSERGLYSLDIEFHETYVDQRDYRQATDQLFWIDVYNFFGGRV